MPRAESGPESLGILTYLPPRVGRSQAVLRLPKALQKRKCSPEGEHFVTSVLHRGMYMGESDSTASQPPKPVCDWILGFRTNEVK